MAREWRETAGRSGLPVVDFGHVLRVPRRALEELVGTDLHCPPEHADAVVTTSSIIRDVEPTAYPAPRAADAALDAPPADQPARQVNRSRRRRRPADPASQPTLPFAG